MATRPAIFKWRQTEPVLILSAVRWYLRYSLSLRDVEELLKERGLEVDHTIAALRSRTGGTAAAAPQADQQILARGRDLQCAEQRAIQEGSSPSGVRMRSAVSKGGGNSSPAGRVEGMEKPTRAQSRKSDTAKADLKPPLRSTRRAGCPP